MFRTNQGEQYYEGTYFEKKTDVQGISFRYELVDNQREQYGQVINNLIANQGRYTIKTNYDLGFKVKGYIVTKDGKRWTISDITRVEQDVNPQTMYWLKVNMDTDFILSLVEVANEREL